MLTGPHWSNGLGAALLTVRNGLLLAITVLAVGRVVQLTRRRRRPGERRHPRPDRRRWPAGAPAGAAREPDGLRATWTRATWTRGSRAADVALLAGRARLRLGQPARGLHRLRRDDPAPLGRRAGRRGVPGRPAAACRPGSASCSPSAARSSAQVIKPPYMNVEGRTWALRAGVLVCMAATVLAAGLLVGSAEGGRRRRAALAWAAVGGSGLAYLLMIPGGRPLIDVWPILQGASLGVVQGRNPYEMTFAGVPPGQVADCFNYLPGDVPGAAAGAAARSGRPVRRGRGAAGRGGRARLAGTAVAARPPRCRGRGATGGAARRAARLALRRAAGLERDDRVRCAGRRRGAARGAAAVVGGGGPRGGAGHQAARGAAAAAVGAVAVLRAAPGARGRRPGPQPSRCRGSSPTPAGSGTAWSTSSSTCRPGRTRCRSGSCCPVHFGRSRCCCWSRRRTRWCCGRCPAPRAGCCSAAAWCWPPSRWRTSRASSTSGCWPRQLVVAGLALVAARTRPTREVPLPAA